jgi:hypothetical protein
VLGDFNGNPFDPEVCGSDGIFALRDRADVERTWASSLGALEEKRRPLFSPMWSLLPEGAARAPGTHVHNHAKALRWRLYDQILVSRDLIGDIRDRPEIVTEIGGESLVTKGGTPRVSDHLPVQLRVTI